MRLTAEYARELMTPGPYSIEDTADVAEAVKFLTERGFGSVVVIDVAGHPLGVVTKTDLLVHLREREEGRRKEPATIREVMTPAVFSVREDTTARSVVEQLLTLNVHHLFVVDRTNTVVGVITPVDIIRKLE